MANSLGELLKDRGFVDEAALQQALRVARQTGKKLGEVLVESGAVSAQDVMETLCEGQLGLETIICARDGLLTKNNDQTSITMPWRCRTSDNSRSNSFLTTT